MTFHRFVKKKMQCPKLTKSVSNVESFQFSSHTIAKIEHEQKTHLPLIHIFYFGLMCSFQSCNASNAYKVKHVPIPDTHFNNNNGPSIFWFLKMPNISTFVNWKSRTCEKLNKMTAVTVIRAQWTTITICHWLFNIISDINKTNRPQLTLKYTWSISNLLFIKTVFSLFVSLKPMHSEQLNLQRSIKTSSIFAFCFHWIV